MKFILNLKFLWAHNDWCKLIVLWAAISFKCNDYKIVFTFTAALRGFTKRLLKYYLNLHLFIQINYLYIMTLCEKNGSQRKKGISIAVGE